MICFIDHNNKTYGPPMYGARLRSELSNQGHICEAITYGHQISPLALHTFRGM